MKKILAIVLTAFEIVLSAFFLYQLYLLKFLPYDKYLLVCGGVLLVCAGLVFLAKYKKTLIASIIVSILLIGTLSYLTYNVMISRNMLMEAVDNDTNAPAESLEYVSVIVLKDNGYAELNDIAGKTVGIDTSVDENKLIYASKQLKEKHELSYEDAPYEDIMQLLDDLLGKKLDAAIIESSKYELYDDIIEGFTANTIELTREEIDYSAMPEPEPTIPVSGVPTPVITHPLDEPVLTEGPKYTPTATPSPRPTVTPFGDTRPLTDRPFAIYLSGIDTTGPVAKVSRSDTNVIMCVNPATHKILLVSTPRDTYTQLFGVSGWRYDKLTHAGLYGVKCSLHTLEYMYDIHIDRYIRINFTSMIEITNALKGVDVYSAYEFNSRNMPGYHYDKGMNHIWGAKALAFCRERYSFGDGDFQRGRNHVEMIKAIVNKISSPSILYNYPAVINALSGSFQTDLSYDEMASLIQMQIDSGFSWEFDSITLNNIGGYSRECYSLRGPRLYVGYIDEKSRAKVEEKLHNFLVYN